jgi:hypothetical protein
MSPAESLEAGCQLMPRPSSPLPIPKLPHHNPNQYLLSVFTVALDIQHREPAESLFFEALASRPIAHSPQQRTSQLSQRYDST